MNVTKLVNYSSITMNFNKLLTASHTEAYIIIAGHNESPNEYENAAYCSVSCILIQVGRITQHNFWYLLVRATTLK
jgi:hypothetical protein